MTRLDVIKGDTSRVQPLMVQKVMLDTTPTSFPWLNTSSFGKTRIRRIRESLAVGSPPLTPVFDDACYAEQSLVILVIGEDPRDGPGFRNPSAPGNSRSSHGGRDSKQEDSQNDTKDVNGTNRSATKGEDAMALDAWFVRKERAVEWFTFERFPVGWMRSSDTITFGDMDAFARRVRHFANVWNELVCPLDGGEQVLGKC
jgi:hypothetical protein